MRYKIQAPAVLKTVVQLPASKSISNRVLIMHALSEADTPLKNLSDCDDTNVMVAALSSVDEVIDIKAAGTAMRFLTAFFAIRDGVHVLTGTERMKNRPIKILVDALRQLGAQIDYLGKEGFPPLRIEGRVFAGGEITLDGSVSSQYISALLMIAPMMKNGLVLHLIGTIISRPYIRLTLALMREFGIESKWHDDTIEITSQQYMPRTYAVESDWSAASYWYEMAALNKNSEIELLGLYEHSHQGDARLVEIFEKLGVSTLFTEHGVKLRHNKSCVQRFCYDFVNQPDLVQTFTVTAAMMNIPFRFDGLQTLKIKETDRIAALITELGKWGYRLKEIDNASIEWTGEYDSPAVSQAIDTYEDHRMALAFAPAALVKKQVEINNPEVISKSYPNYWADLQKAGFLINEE